MAKISDYALKPDTKIGSNTSSSAIVIIDSSDGIDDEDYDSSGSTSYPPLVSLCDEPENENRDASEANERSNNQSSSCSSDEESMDDVERDVNIQPDIQVNMNGG